MLFQSIRIASNPCQVQRRKCPRGQRTDYDKLILEIWTDGRITPGDAVLQASAILRHHLDVFVNYDYEQIQFNETPEEVNQENTG